MYLWLNKQTQSAKLVIWSKTSWQIDWCCGLPTSALANHFFLRFQACSDLLAKRLLTDISLLSHLAKHSKQPSTANSKTTTPRRHKTTVPPPSQQQQQQQQNCLLFCPNCHRIRRDTIMQIQDNYLDIQTLLFGNQSLRTHQNEFICKKVNEFIRRTRRF